MEDGDDGCAGLERKTEAAGVVWLEAWSQPGPGRVSPGDRVPDSAPPLHLGRVSAVQNPGMIVIFSYQAHVVVTSDSTLLSFRIGNNIAKNCEMQEFSCFQIMLNFVS